MRDEYRVGPQYIQHFHYLQAKRWLQKLIKKWQEEKYGGLELTAKTAELAKILDKLEQAVFQVAVFGMVGRGKSSVLNAITHRQVFKTGALHGVTQSIKSVKLDLEKKTQKEMKLNFAQSDIKSNLVDSAQINTSFSLHSDFIYLDTQPTEEQNPHQNWQRSIQFFDTPGIDEVNGLKQSALSYRLANQVDLILFVIAGDLNQVEYDAITKLQKKGKPLLLVFNKIDLYPELDRLALYQKISSCRVKEFLSPSEIVMVAAAPTEVRGRVREDGKIIRERSPAKPNICQLEQKIAEIIDHKAKSLAVLNNTFTAQKILQQLLQIKIKQLDLAANKLIAKLVCMKAVLLGLIPVAIADLLIGASLDLGLILALSALYEVSLPSSGAIAVLSVISLGMAAVGTIDLLLHFTLNYLFSTSGILESIQAYLSKFTPLLFGFGQGIVAGISVITLGQAAKRQLKHGLAWDHYQARQIMQTTINFMGGDTLISKIKANLD